LLNFNLMYRKKLKIQPCMFEIKMQALFFF
jgi:hypothetical protein